MRIVKIDDTKIVPIVGDGAIALPVVAGGRLIPVLIIDCDRHAALYDSILIHRDTAPGDVTITWSRKLVSKNLVFLHLQFLRPIETTATFCFNLQKQAILVDGIIRAHGVYLQPLQSGKSVSEGLDKPKILVEVPSTAILPFWADMYKSTLIKSYSSRGVSRREARRLADEHLKKTAEMWSARASRGDDRG